MNYRRQHWKWDFFISNEEGDLLKYMHFRYWMKQADLKENHDF